MEAVKLRALLALVIVFAPFMQAARAGCADCAELGGINYKVVLTGGAEADQALPMLVALHFMTGAPETSRGQYAEFDAPARVLLPAGPYPIEGGYSWFPEGYYELGEEEQAAFLEDAALRVAAFVEQASAQYPTAGLPVITGYSQGGDIVARLGLARSDIISTAMPMGARFLPQWKLLEKRKTTEGAGPVKDIIIFHGGADTIVDVDNAFASARHFTGLGASTKLYVYRDTGHGYPPQMKTDFNHAVVSAMQREAAKLITAR